MLKVSKAAKAVRIKMLTELKVLDGHATTNMALISMFLVFNIKWFQELQPVV